MEASHNLNNTENMAHGRIVSRIKLHVIYVGLCRTINFQTGRSQAKHD